MKQTSKIILYCLLSAYCNFSDNLFAQNASRQTTSTPIYITFLWHMHQPLYYPGETIAQTEAAGHFSFSVKDVHTNRSGPYTSWPKSAIDKLVAAGLSGGAQVTLTGSLIENLNTLESSGTAFSNWKSSWISAASLKTAAGNLRLDLVNFGYYHPLMGLIDYADVKKQIQKHQQTLQTNFGVSASKGIFPPENAFSIRMILALKDAGVQWVIVDNSHFERACSGYPFSTGGNLYEPNKSDVRNPNPNDWVQLNGLWAPTKVSARWAHQPHYVEYVDPVTGTTSRIVAVPGDRYMGNEDARGGFGALQYETVMSQIESYNTDPSHPILIVLPHDGDNYGGGAESYYNGNFQSFVNWLQANPSRFICTTIQDYLDLFPPSETDVIHVEDGSWSGADNGDPEFLKWNGNPDAVTGYSPDRNSWSIVTAAKNLVLTADQINSSDTRTQQAWTYLMMSEASDYWYWDGTEVWDSNPVRACNLAVPLAQQVVSGGTDLTPPTIYLPQREPYNPGATEWTIAKPSDFSVWTYAYDISGMKSVKLCYRTSTNETVTTGNLAYTKSVDVSEWTNITMTDIDQTSTTNPSPLLKAKEFRASITGLKDTLVDYYVEAIDEQNNIARSPVQHVWIGSASSGGSGTQGTISWLPTSPTKDNTIRISLNSTNQSAKLHWGVNSWQLPNSAYWPSGSAIWTDNKAIESPFPVTDTSGSSTLILGPFNDSAQTISAVNFVIHYNDGTWDNNNGSDYSIALQGVQSASDSLIVHFYKPIAWTNAWIYVWGITGVTSPGWPGTAMTSENNGWYKYVIHGTKTCNLIFNNQGQPQTADLYRDKEGWYYNSTWYETNPLTSVEDQNQPLTFMLEQNYPNPFNPTTTINYQIPTSGFFQIWEREGFVTLQLYDVLGREVRVLVNGFMMPGSYSVTFDAGTLPSGVYFYRLTAGTNTAIRRMLLLK
jgi:hypothetical protein